MYPKNKKIKVEWLDAIMYAKPKTWKDIPNIARMFTTGELYQETKEWIFIKNPLTYQYSEKLKDFKLKEYETKPTFFCIPKGMIVKIIPGKLKP